MLVVFKYITMLSKKKKVEQLKAQRALSARVDQDYQERSTTHRSNYDLKKSIFLKKGLSDSHAHQMAIYGRIKY
jgi:hypothetical protein